MYPQVLHFSAGLFCGWAVWRLDSCPWGWWSLRRCCVIWRLVLCMWWGVCMYRMMPMVFGIPTGPREGTHRASSLCSSHFFSLGCVVCRHAPIRISLVDGPLSFVFFAEACEVLVEEFFCIERVWPAQEVEPFFHLCRYFGRCSVWDVISYHVSWEFIS